MTSPDPLSPVLDALGESESSRDARIRSLFASFDAASSGRLDHAQIAAGLAGLRVPAEYKYATDLLRVCDANSDGKVDYAEFRRYMDEKEVELLGIFREVDVDRSGSIVAGELREALLRAGIIISDEELVRFVEHIDKDNNGIITFEEWRDFLLLHPHEATMENIYQHWGRVCLVDIGEQTVIPEGISKHPHPSKYLIAGGIAGAISRTATAPLDRLKVAMQVQTKKAQLPSAAKEIWKEGRFMGFFRGNGLNVIKVTPESAIKFYTYETLKDVIVKLKGDGESDIGTSGRLIAGGMAGAVAQTAIYPMELVKTRLQTCASEGGKGPKLGTLTRAIWVHEGPRAFYRGVVPSLIGIIPYAGIDFAAYESFKDISRKYILADKEPGPVVQLGCGTMSGALGAACVYPLQLVRTRMQAQSSDGEDAYKGMSDVFRKTFQREGFLGFYKGIMPNFLKVIPAVSITYLVYEDMKKRLALE